MALFKSVKGDHTNADIGWRFEKSAAYEVGYLIAAEKLYKSFSSFTTFDKDSTIFPIIFLYRQHIELVLKSLIRELDKLNRTSQVRKSLKSHNLLCLWDEMVESYNVCLSTYPSPFGTPLSDFKKQRSVVVEFNKVDELSFSFRYSTDKKGVEQLSGITHISLKNFKTEIDVVIKILGQIQDELALINDYLESI